MRVGWGLLRGLNDPVIWLTPLYYIFARSGSFNVTDWLIPSTVRAHLLLSIHYDTFTTCHDLYSLMLLYQFIQLCSKTYTNIPRFLTIYIYSIMESLGLETRVCVPASTNTGDGGLGINPNLSLPSTIWNDHIWSSKHFSCCSSKLFLLLWSSRATNVPSQLITSVSQKEPVVIRRTQPFL